MYYTHTILKRFPLYKVDLHWKGNRSSKFISHQHCDGGGEGRFEKVQVARYLPTEFFWCLFMDWDEVSELCNFREQNRKYRKAHQNAGCTSFCIFSESAF